MLIGIINKKKKKSLIVTTVASCPINCEASTLHSPLKTLTNAVGDAKEGEQYIK